MKAGRQAAGCAVAIAIVLALVVWRNFAGAEKQLEHPFPRLYAVQDSDFIRAMGIALGPSVAAGNRVDPLQNGDEIFPAMLAAIRGAQRSITFETYIYWAGQVGKAFADALAERARAGVQVHVLVDWAGSTKMDTGAIGTLQRAGVAFRKYRPLRWYNLGRLNNRTHRKLLVVDGRIGFTGGVGIADMWSGRAQDPEHWRDSHFRLEGPAVGQMQAAFLDNWIEATGEVLHGSAYFPSLDSAGAQAAQVFVSSIDGGSENLELMFLLALTAASRSIALASAYFIPDQLTNQALLAARSRGVTVQIITAGPHTDAETTRRASRARWGELLAAGAEIYEYQPTMYHSKVLIIDRRFVSVGSANFDPRSFRLNDEANLNIYDAGLAERLLTVFEQDMKHSHRVTLPEWRARPWREKLAERLASLLGPAL